MIKESKLELFKKKYAEIQNKHDLPSFEELNQDFHIEKLCKTESDYLVREIRKFMIEKLQNYARFIESIINPSGASIFIFSIIKTLNEEDKKILSEVYKKLSRIEIDLIDLDLYFSEQKEVEFVKSFSSVWQSIKKDLLGVLGSIKNNWDKGSEKGTNAYFG